MLVYHRPASPLARLTIFVRRTLSARVQGSIKAKNSYWLGAPNTNRTCDLPLRRGLLYPLSYRGVARILTELPFASAGSCCPAATVVQRTFQWISLSQAAR